MILLNKSHDRTSHAADIQAKSVMLPNDTDGKMSRMLCNLLRLQSAPDVDIQSQQWNSLDTA